MKTWLEAVVWLQLILGLIVLVVYESLSVVHTMSLFTWQVY